MPNEDRIGFAVVGLGSIAQSSVLPAFANSKRARLVAVVSRDEEKASQIAKQYGARHSYSQRHYSHCLANPEVQAVFIATPQGTHELLTEQAARAGKHVLCEKPLAASLDQASRMVKACRKHRVMLMTAYRKYYEPSAKFLKQLVRDGSLGRLEMIHTGFSELFRPGVSPSWLVDKKLAGGGYFKIINQTVPLLREYKPLGGGGTSGRSEGRDLASRQEEVPFGRGGHQLPAVFRERVGGARQFYLWRLPNFLHDPAREPRMGVAISSVYVRRSPTTPGQTARPGDRTRLSHRG